MCGSPSYSYQLKFKPIWRNLQTGMAFLLQISWDPPSHFVFGDGKPNGLVPVVWVLENAVSCLVKKVEVRGGGRGGSSTWSLWKPVKINWKKLLKIQDADQMYLQARPHPAPIAKVTAKLQIYAEGLGDGKWDKSIWILLFHLLWPWAIKGLESLFYVFSWLPHWQGIWSHLNKPPRSHSCNNTLSNIS